jgi:DNA modification methylase
MKSTLTTSNSAKTAAGAPTSGRTRARRLWASDARRSLQDHPTVKPTVLLADALLDLTSPGDIVLDPFLGSGSTLIAAHATSRVCQGVELDPLYVDVIVRRWEEVTGVKAALLI